MKNLKLKLNLRLNLKLLLIVLFGCIVFSTPILADPPTLPQVQSSARLAALAPHQFLYIFRSDIGITFKWNGTNCASPGLLQVQSLTGTGCWIGGFVTLPDLETQAARTVIGNTTNGTASPTAGFLVSGTASTLATTTGGLVNGDCVEIDVNGNFIDFGAPCGAGGGGGAVTSVGLSVPGSSIFGVTGSPITTSGTLGLTTSGTSGGAAYFSSSSQISSSGLLTLGEIVAGGGAGGAPSTGGNISSPGSFTLNNNLSVTGSVTFSGITASTAGNYVCRNGTTIGYGAACSGSSVLANTVITPQQYGAVCDGSTDDSTAIINWVAAITTGKAGYVPPGNCIFKTAIVFPKASYVSISGDGESSKLTYAGSNTTNNVLTFGVANDSADAYCSVISLTIHGLYFSSNTVMTGGDGLLLNDICQADIENITVGAGFDGNANWYNAIHFNGGNTVHYRGYISRGSHAGEIINGETNPAIQFTDMYQSQGVVLESGIGLIVGGNVGGLAIEQSDFLENGTNVRIDQSQVAVANNQVFFGTETSIDATVGGAGIGLDIADAGGGISQIYINGGTYASATNQCILFESGVHWLVTMTGAQVLSCGSDGIKNESTQLYLNITGGTMQFNGGYGINSTVTDSNIVIQSTLFHANGSGDFSTATINPVSYVEGNSNILFAENIDLFTTSTMNPAAAVLSVVDASAVAHVQINQNGDILDTTGNVAHMPADPRVNGSVLTLGSTDTNSTREALFAFGTGTASTIDLYAARGTEISPSAIQNGDTFAGFLAGGYDGTNWSTSATILPYALENWTSIAHGTQIGFNVAAIGSTAFTTVMKMKATDVEMDTQLVLSKYTVSTLPAGVQGGIAFVTDESGGGSCASPGSSISGGGSKVCPVFFNGSAWVGL